MKRKTVRGLPALTFQTRTMPISLIDCRADESAFSKKELKNRAAYFLLNGAPVFSVNEQSDGRFLLLAAERDFVAWKQSGAKDVEVRVYSFTDEHAAVFSVVEKLKNERLGATDEGYLMKSLIDEHGFTQESLAALIGKSRPAVANTLRLLTLEPQVLGLVESGRLSAGHARTLVKVPKDKQVVFAEEAVRRNLSVREMERTIKAFLTPPEILQQEKAAKAAAKSEQLKAFVERMRGAFRTKVSLIGNAQKGRIYIDYYSPEDLYRFEELLEMIESFDRS
ncbi:MAG: ParB/RepB/Spo0J family partition protein [Clostridia bacterium]|nr:ParB/RepB/Spo0J family partition protein [Clostridia bacterium]